MTRTGLVLRIDASPHSHVCMCVFCPSWRTLTNTRTEALAALRAHARTHTGTPEATPVYRALTSLTRTP